MGTLTWHNIEQRIITRVIRCHTALCYSIPVCLNVITLFDVCVSSLRRGHADLLCIIPIVTDDPRGESIFIGICLGPLFRAPLIINLYVII